jgi:primase-polymerase (primpol)-like protein
MSLTDANLLDKARRAVNGDAFSRLFDYGDWHGRYASESEGDLALCNHLAFWTGRDPDRIDSLFRQSALFDEKWEGRDDYRESTISLAISGVKSVYDPGHYQRKSTHERR